jgi:hypothetical protein
VPSLRCWRRSSRTWTCRSRCSCPRASASGPPYARVTLKLRELSPLARIASGEVGRVAQDHVEGKLELDGSMRDVMHVAAQLIGDDPTRSERGAAPLRWWTDLLRQSRSRSQHSRRADAEQIQFHYDVSDDFYALWLDPQRVYSCAYFRDPAMDIAQAQEGQARPSLPQADAARGRALSRHRRRLGRAAAVGGRALRRAGARHHACRRTSMPT